MLDAWDDIHTVAAVGSGTSTYNGNVRLTTDRVVKDGKTRYEMRDPTRGNFRTLDADQNQDTPFSCFLTNVGCTRASTTLVFGWDNVWGSSDPSNRHLFPAVDVHYGAAAAWDYFKNIHGRNGYDGRGGSLFNRVHYGLNFPTAFYTELCGCLTFGDGDGTTLGAWTSLDVVGHEWTHAVIYSTAKLIYSGESGGLNEATADIFGTMIEFYKANSRDPGDYVWGEKVVKNGLRSMITPSRDGKSADCWYSGVGDLDSHYSSGVANHFFYLLAEGTHDGGLRRSKTCAKDDTRVATGTKTLQGIGRDKAAKIWYRALTKHMTSNTNYARARINTIVATQKMYGYGSPEEIAVGAAWTAVGVVPIHPPCGVVCCLEATSLR